MGLLDPFRKAFGAKLPLDVAKTYQLDRHSFTGTMSKFRVATKIGTKDKFGIKFIDQEKLDHFESRFKGLKKPSEGEIAMQFDHPLIVKTYEHGKTSTGQNYILMEYIQGTGLDVALREREQRLVPHRLKLIKDMATALQVVHEKGFIHRDVCPRNFIVLPDWKTVKLIDFGLTLPNEPPYRMPGNRTGTPQYMAPEIVRRRETDQRLDLFAFGVTAYRLLTFEHPWGTTDQTGTAALAHDSKPMIDIREHRPNLDPHLVKLIHSCLAVKADDRLSSFKRFLATAKRILREEAA